MNAIHLGWFNTSSTRTHVRFQFSTHAAAGGNVAPNSAFEAADLRIYKATDGAAFSATQRSSANGITMTSPFDSLTGFHDVDIDLTDNTDSGFYAAGSTYSVVLAPDETVDSQTITAIVLAVFEIGRPQTDVRQFGGSDGTFASGLPAVNATQFSGSTTAADNAEVVFSTDFATNYNTTNDKWQVEANVTHAAGTAWASGAITAAAFASDAITAAKLHSDVTTELQSGLATAAELAKVPKSDSNVTWNATALASLQQEATDALNAYDPPTNTEMEARTIAAANYATAANLATVDTVVDAIKVTSDKLDDTLEDDGGTYRFTVNALEQAPAGGGGGDTDWTSDERTAIRSILGIPGSGTTPADPSTGILDTIRDNIAGLNNLSAAQVNAECDTALSDYGALKPTTAGRTLDVTAGGEAGIDWANVGSPTTTLNLSGTTVATVTNRVTANTDQWGGTAVASALVRSNQIQLEGADATDTFGALFLAVVSAQIESYGLHMLVSSSADGVSIADNSIIAKLVSKNATADWDTYVNTTHSMEAQRDNVGTAGAGLTAADDAVIAAITAAETTIIDGVLDGVKISKNTALNNFMFFMRDSSDHAAGKTGLTITATRSLDGGSFASCANSATEVANGWYKINLAATDTNADTIALDFAGTGAVTARIFLTTQPKD